MNDVEKLADARQMFANWEARNWSEIIDSFATDGTLHSMMSEPVSGRVALEALFDGFKDVIISHRLGCVLYKYNVVSYQYSKTY